MSQAISNEQKPKVSDRRLHLRPEEANRLIAAAGQRGRHRFRDRALVRAVYRHGLRAAEAVGLRWSQFDLDGRPANLIVKRAKGGRTSTHVLDADEVRDFRKLQKASTGPYVFQTERGGPLSVDALQYIVREAGKAAKLEVPAHPHMLRHAAGYYLINEGVDVRLVQDHLGHKNITSTAHYTALCPKRLENVRVR